MALTSLMTMSFKTLKKSNISLAFSPIFPMITPKATKNPIKPKRHGTISSMVWFLSRLQQMIGYCVKWINKNIFNLWCFLWCFSQGSRFQHCLPKTFIPPLNWSDRFTVNCGGPFVRFVGTGTLVVTVWIWMEKEKKKKDCWKRTWMRSLNPKWNLPPTCWKQACTKFSGKRFRTRSKKASTLDTSSFFFPCPRLAFSFGFPGWMSSTRTTPRTAAITVVDI